MNNTTDNFQWSDEAAIEFLNFRMKYGAGFPHKTALEYFKQSKLQQPKEEQPKRFEVQGFCRPKGAISNVSGKPYNIYEFTSFDVIPEEKYEAIKLAIERELNGDNIIGYTLNLPEDLTSPSAFQEAMKKYPQYFSENKQLITLSKEKLDAMMENVWNAARDAYRIQIPNGGYRYGDIKFRYESFKAYQQSLPENKQPVEDKEKADWEIESYKNITNDEIFTLASVWNNPVYREGFKDYTGGFKTNDCFIIHSVLRKSDNTTFTVGDRIGWGEVGSYETGITSFKIKEGRLKVGYYDGTTHNKYEEFYFVDFEDAIRLHKKSETQTTSNASIKCQNEEIVKPPLGLMSEFIWLEKRMDDIQDAMERYSKFGKPIPIKWNNELIEVCKKMLTKKIKQ